VTPTTIACNITEPLTPSTYTTPTTSPEFQRSVMNMDHEEEKNNIIKMPRHVTPNPIISSHTSHIIFPAQYGLSYGF
jgi:hypothetical protein